MTPSLARPAGALPALAALLVAAAPLAAQAPARADSAQPIALDQAMRLADRNSPQTVQSRGQIRTSQAGVTSAWASFLPRLDVSAGLRKSSGARYDRVRDVVIEQGTTRSYGDAYTAQLEVFDGGERFFNLRQARQNVHAAEAGDVAQRFTVRLNVAQQYYNVLAAHEAAAAARAQLEQAEQQLRVSSARVAAGAATRSDSLRAIIQVGNARLALLTAQNNLNSANAALTRLVAAPRLVTALPADTLAQPTAVPDSVALLRLAETGPLVDQARAQHEAAQAGERGAWTSYLPRVTMTFQRGRERATDGFEIMPSSLPYSNSLSLGLNLPIFDRWQREQQRVTADVQEDVAEAQLRDARLQAQQTLVQNLGTLRTAQERIEIQSATVAAAEEDLRVQQQRYALGASTQLDVLTSQTQLDQARAQLIQARYDYRVARASIEALIGRPLP